MSTFGTATVEGTKSIVFSLALLKSSAAAWPYYKHCTLDLIHAKAHAFPNAEFVVHLNEEASSPDTTAMLHAVGGANIRLITYRFNRRCQPWLVAGMRLSTIFDLRYRHKMVVVVDVHDDQRMQNKQIRTLLDQLYAQGKELALTFWESSDAECICHCALPRPPQMGKHRRQTHHHTDAGLLIWLPGGVRDHVHELRLSYADFLQEMVDGAGTIPRGIDEVIFDTFLKYIMTAEQIMKITVFTRHKHSITIQPRSLFDRSLSSQFATASGKQAVPPSIPGLLCVRVTRFCGKLGMVLGQLEDPPNVVIYKIGCPAVERGFQIGDILISVHNTPVQFMSEVREILQDAPNTFSCMVMRRPDDDNNDGISAAAEAGSAVVPVQGVEYVSLSLGSRSMVQLETCPELSNNAVERAAASGARQQARSVSPTKFIDSKSCGCGGGGGGGEQGSSGDPAAVEDCLVQAAWVQCERCEKWRTLAPGQECWDGDFLCEMNTWDEHNDCSKQQQGVWVKVGKEWYRERSMVEVLWPPTGKWHEATVLKIEFKRDCPSPSARRKVKAQSPPALAAVSQAPAAPSDSVTFTIQYQHDDLDEIESGVHAARVRDLGDAAATVASRYGEAEEPPPLAVGQRVRARWQGGVRGYPGVVKRAHPDGTLFIAYDDGDAEDHVERQFVELESASRDDDDDHQQQNRLQQHAADADEDENTDANDAEATPTELQRELAAAVRYAFLVLQLQTAEKTLFLALAADVGLSPAALGGFLADPGPQPPRTIRSVLRWWARCQDGQTGSALVKCVGVVAPKVATPRGGGGKSGGSSGNVGKGKGKDQGTRDQNKHIASCSKCDDDQPASAFACRRGPWSTSEHARYLSAVRVHGSDYGQIQRAVRTRDRAQVRRHHLAHTKKQQKAGAPRGKQGHSGPADKVAADKAAAASTSSGTGTENSSSAGVGVSVSVGVGTAVEARYHGSSEWYPGVIAGVVDTVLYAGQERYDVQFNDGYRDASVPARSIRTRGAAAVADADARADANARADLNGGSGGGGEASVRGADTNAAVIAISSDDDDGIYGSGSISPRTIKRNVTCIGNEHTRRNGTGGDGIASTEARKEMAVDNLARKHTNGISAQACSALQRALTTRTNQVGGSGKFKANISAAYKDASAELQEQLNLCMSIYKANAAGAAKNILREILGLSPCRCAGFAVTADISTDAGKRKLADRSSSTSSSTSTTSSNGGKELKSTSSRQTQNKLKHRGKNLRWQLDGHDWINHKVARFFGEEECMCYIGIITHYLPPVLRPESELGWLQMEKAKARAQAHAATPTEPKQRSLQLVPNDRTVGVEGKESVDEPAGKEGRTRVGDGGGSGKKRKRACTVDPACVICTFLNKGTAQDCAMCGSQLGRVSTGAGAGAGAGKDNTNTKANLDAEVSAHAEADTDVHASNGSITSASTSKAAASVSIKEPALFRVVFGDGDQEDLEEHEVQEALWALRQRLLTRAADIPGVIVSAEDSCAAAGDAEYAVGSCVLINMVEGWRCARIKSRYVPGKGRRTKAKAKARAKPKAKASIHPGNDHNDKQSKGKGEGTEKAKAVRDRGSWWNAVFANGDRRVVSTELATRGWAWELPQTAVAVVHGESNAKGDKYEDEDGHERGSGVYELCGESGVVSLTRATVAPAHTPQSPTTKANRKKQPSATETPGKYVKRQCIEPTEKHVGNADAGNGSTVSVE